ncbi:MAG: 2-oxo acid dehydrogenase subunit E2 [Immundisolibacter sp.]|uniref:dihydrolipoamide acetyltransferase family protein n=2 Tax=Immundisolibacter sp. TaxID=1934948 RepID=UPI0019BA397E|nr:dihydrolipoamide acetyltransferase family protein [Immundisolibacter sp.]MBC7162382.1 2-oxo acid dehydrogenase subunit E2 [Immundisolibacter sp.]
MADFVMPSLGSDMESGKLIEWRIKPGDRVRRGDIVAVVETQKGAIDVEIFDSGVVESLVVPPGAEVPVGTVLATVRSDGETAPEPPATAAAPMHPPAPAAAPAPPAAPAPAPAIPSGEPSPRERLRASPAARQRAAALGIDLATLTGSGPGGAITLADVEAAPAKQPVREPRASPSVRQRALELGIDLAQVTGSGAKGAITVADLERAAASAKPAAPARPSAAPFEPDAMRRAIAAAMARSKREIPHYYLATTVDFEPALRFVERVNAQRDPEQRLLYAVLLIKALARALKEVPELNGFWRQERFEPSAAAHVGVAVALRRRGLIAPALHDVADKDLDTLMTELKDLVQRARAGGLRSSELTDPTITLSSLGDNGVETLYPIITPPQVAVVGAGSVVRRPWVVGEGLAVRRVITLTLAGDHRVSDGHRGALFLAALDRLLQKPEEL